MCHQPYSDIGYIWTVAMGSSDMTLSCHAGAQIKVHIPHKAGSHPGGSNTKMLVSEQLGWGSCTGSMMFSYIDSTEAGRGNLAPSRPAFGPTLWKFSWRHLSLKGTWSSLFYPSLGTVTSFVLVPWTDTVSKRNILLPQSQTVKEFLNSFIWFLCKYCSSTQLTLDVFCYKACRKWSEGQGVSIPLRQKLNPFQRYNR
jgi:hypothetical protein